MRQQPTSVRLPEVTVQLIAELSKKLGLRRSQVIVLAIDRMAMDEIERSRRQRQRKRNAS